MEYPPYKQSIKWEYPPYKQSIKWNIHHINQSINNQSINGISTL